MDVLLSDRQGQDKAISRGVTLHFEMHILIHLYNVSHLLIWFEVMFDEIDKEEDGEVYYR